MITDRNKHFFRHGENQNSAEFLEWFDNKKKGASAFVAPFITHTPLLKYSLRTHICFIIHCPIVCLSHAFFKFNCYFHTFSFVFRPEQQNAWHLTLILQMFVNIIFLVVDINLFYFVEMLKCFIPSIVLKLI